MKMNWGGWKRGAAIAAGLILSSAALAASDVPALHVKTSLDGGTVRLEAQASAPFEYTAYRPSASLYVLDLTGVTPGDADGARVVSSDIVKSYRVLTYSAGDKPVVRIEILLDPNAETHIERTNSQDLTLLVTRASAAASTAPAKAKAKPSASAPAFVRAAAKSSDAKATGTTAPGTDASVPTIRQIHLSQNGEATVVSILGSGHLNYRPALLQNPDRLVLDFADSRLKTPEKRLASNLDPVREIRAAQFTPQTSRVVIDLREPAAYKITAADDAVNVEFAPKPAASGTTQTAPAEESSHVTQTKAPDTKNASVDQASATPAAIPAPPAVLPVALTRTSSALAAQETSVPQPLPAIEMAKAAADSSAPAANSQTPSSPAPPDTTPTGPPAAQPPPSDAQAPVPAPSSKYTGEPISVNLKDVDLEDFFRLIHEISGLNVVVDPNVKGTLTIVLDDVPWDQALDLVLRNNDLEKQLEGNVLRIATKETIMKADQESRDLARAQIEAADVVTTTRVLSYAKATSLVVTLKKFLTSRGDMFADDRTNTLIIRDVPSTLPVLDNLIRQLDKKSQQVEIEARVVAANRNFSREIGTELGFAARSGNSALAGDNAVGTSPTIFFPPPPVVVGTPSTGTTPTPGSPPLATSLEASSPTSGIQYLFASPNFALDFVLDAAEQRGVGKLLSKPKVITQNNMKATVKQGTKIPVQTIVNNTVSVEFVDAVLELDVTPQITAEGTIYMDVTVENDAIDNGIPRVEGIPAIDTQSAETKVTVQDGSTVVIGGIIITNQQNTVNQVPLLGSVPLLGNLFKHTTVSSQSQELLFFLTPRILPS